ncbi:ABC transporter permease [Microvirga thermotolerans]|uniref:Transport permease protein n=1 Tax=Microvirga thermotolerans TaxID=2651334 RepID=A0A5P9JY10_9HYPH|nr:ABC transporter permease [Microvirga thermotolerans]QFU17497.1 ABC transporter permease subunit [Microvirga thermotolerans]
MTAPHALRALAGITRREFLKLVGQSGRLASAIVRPLVWLGLFGAGFRSVLGLSIIPPYETYILYEVYIVPGLAAMMLLFHAFQGSLSMVYDREMGSMRVLLTAPLPRWWLLTARLVANTLAVVPLVYLFLLIARVWDVRPPALGYVAVLPALLLAGMMLGALGLLLSSFIRQLENFAGVMNFAIFPMFFASTALYPLWRLDEVSPTLAWLALLNPFTHAVEMIRFALYLRSDPLAIAVCGVTLVLGLTLAAFSYDPGRGFWAHRRAD